VLGEVYAQPQRSFIHIVNAKIAALVFSIVLGPVLWVLVTGGEDGAAARAQGEGGVVEGTCASPEPVGHAVRHLVRNHQEPMMDGLRATRTSEALGGRRWHGVSPQLLARQLDSNILLVGGRR
jgi:hypothetical protein